MRIHPSSGGDCPPVTFKNDGKRFKDLQHSETSIKLRSQMDYFIGLKVMPPVLIRWAVRISLDGASIYLSDGCQVKESGTKDSLVFKGAFRSRTCAGKRGPTAVFR